MWEPQHTLPGSIPSAGGPAPGTDPRTNSSRSSSSDGQVIRPDSFDLSLQEAKRRVQQDSTKVLTETPKTSDLLGPFSAGCVIANRMIGTGIFDGPTTILQQNHNVGGTLMLWAAGFIASVAGVLLGGELNYLTYLVQSPRFFAACMFGWTFVLVGNSAANCMSFGVHIIQAFEGDASHAGKVQAIAITVATVVCTIHALGRNFGITLNNIFATGKVGMLCVVIILGFMVLHNTVITRDPGSYANLAPATSFKPVATGPRGAHGYAAAYLDIIFTFGGWNQANYVLGEIKTPNKGIGWMKVKKFRLTAVATVVFIGILYMLTNIAYMIVVPFPRDGKGFPDDFSIVNQFFLLTIGQIGGEKSARKTVNFFLAFSSLGNIIVTTFTAARVKQEIAKEGVLPVSRILQENINILSYFSKKRNQNLEDAQAAILPPASATQPIQLPNLGHEHREPGTVENPRILGRSAFEPIPVPALGLHCFFTYVLIFSSWGIVPPKDSYPLFIGIYSYNIDAIVVLCLGFGMFWMRFFPSFITKHNQRKHNIDIPSWKDISGTNQFYSLIPAAIAICANGFPIVALWIHKLAEELGTKIPWFVIPTTGWSLILSGFFYWVILSKIVPLFHSGEQLVVDRHPIIFRVGGEYMSMAEENRRAWQILDRVAIPMDSLDGHGRRVS